MSGTAKTSDMKERIMPPVVLTIICIIVSALLAAAYNATYVDNTGVMTDKLKAGCEEVFGQGSYEILTYEDAESGKKLPVTFDTEGVNAIITDKDSGNCLIELTQDGYSKGGLHLLIGFDSEGAVSGISFVSISETPGLGTNVQNESFWGKFVGFKAGDSVDGIDNVTAATYSSKGMKAAVVKAAELYSQHKEEIFGGE